MGTRPGRGGEERVDGTGTEAQRPWPFEPENDRVEPPRCSAATFVDVYAVRQHQNNTGQNRGMSRQAKAPTVRPAGQANLGTGPERGIGPWPVVGGQKRLGVSGIRRRLDGKTAAIQHADDLLGALTKCAGRKEHVLTTQQLEDRGAKDGRKGSGRFVFPSRRRDTAQRGRGVEKSPLRAVATYLGIRRPTWHLGWARKAREERATLWTCGCWC